MAFVKTLLRVQNNVINIPGGREHFDIYLAKTIYPVLVPGLESLAKEVDRLMNPDGKTYYNSLILLWYRINWLKYKRKVQSLHIFSWVFDEK